MSYETYNKVDRDTLSAETSTSSDSVDVVLLVCGQVVAGDERVGY